MKGGKVFSRYNVRQESESRYRTRCKDAVDESRSAGISFVEDMMQWLGIKIRLHFVKVGLQYGEGEQNFACVL